MAQHRLPDAVKTSILPNDLPLASSTLSLLNPNSNPPSIVVVIVNINRHSSNNKNNDKESHTNQPLTTLDRVPSYHRIISLLVPTRRGGSAEPGVLGSLA